MSIQGTGKGVERMFPFVLRSRNLIVGREALQHSKRRLHFVLVTHDLSEGSRDAILREFEHYPIVQHYTSAELEQHFGVKGAKVLGFAKSGLAQSIYAELKEHRLNRPVVHAEAAEKEQPEDRGQAAPRTSVRRGRERSGPRPRRGRFSRNR
jgi:hypothetical protein